MFDKFFKRLLIVFLTIGVLLGAYLGSLRYFEELQNKTVEICLDLNDLKKMSALENRSLDDLLNEVKKQGIVSIGLFEQTLPDAAVLGEIYYAKGSGVLRLAKFNSRFADLVRRGYIDKNRTYIYCPSEATRLRLYSHISWTIGKDKVAFVGTDILEIDELEEEIREIGLGISEIQRDYLIKKGFSIIPRVFHDSRFKTESIGAKVSDFKGYKTIIFEGEDILGYPNNILTLAFALRRQNIKYGCIEIIKQSGDKALRRFMGNDLVRVHSASKDELKKITEPAAISRFVRAARERNVRLIYLRPFLPPHSKVDNLAYFAKVRRELEQAGFVIGSAERMANLAVNPWQIFVLGLAVVSGLLLLLNYFTKVNLSVLLFLFSLIMLLFIRGGQILALQKGLALLAALVFPSLAVISSFQKQQQPLLIVLNVVAEIFIGVFILIGLLTDYRFMLGIETFSGVKLALLGPLFIVAAYFIRQYEANDFNNILEKHIKISTLIFSLIILGFLGLMLARSGNFILPVLGIEKMFRGFLEAVLLIRPRTKEFLIGYPALFFAGTLFLKNRNKWLWLLAGIGTMVPISILNSFSHIHTPMMVSFDRTINGLVLGIIISFVLAKLAQRFID